MEQTWYHLLFMHWPVDAAMLRPFIPRELEIEMFDGSAWIGVVPFGMKNIRLRGPCSFNWPPIPGTSAFLELNVRTYVRLRANEYVQKPQQKPGVWFFSLDAANRLAVEVARRWFHLPYYFAAMELAENNNSFHYKSVRTHRSAPTAEFECKYSPSGDVYHSKPGTLDSWLTERYCLYSTNRKGSLMRGEIHHAPWNLQPARAELITNSMPSASTLTIPRKDPILHFSREIDVKIWSIERILTKTSIP